LFSGSNKRKFRRCFATVHCIFLTTGYSTVISLILASKCSPVMNVRRLVILTRLPSGC
jgi:hypothetical protein